MKKSAKLFLFIIILIIIIIGASITKNLIKDNKTYKGELIEASPRPQNISIFVLPPIPIILIISPENKTYSTNTILLNYSMTKEIDFIWYNLDNGINITIDSPRLFNAAEGPHTLYLYANNSQGISFKNISFSIEIPPPQEKDKEYGGGDWPINKTEPSENTTPKETPKNITEKPKETTRPIKLITIIFLISFLFLILLIFLIIILIAEIKKKKEKEKRKRKRGR